MFLRHQVVRFHTDLMRSQDVVITWQYRYWDKHISSKIQFPLLFGFTRWNCEWLRWVCASWYSFLCDKSQLQWSTPCVFSKGRKRAKERVAAEEKTEEEEGSDKCQQAARCLSPRRDNNHGDEVDWCTAVTHDPRRVKRVWHQRFFSVQESFVFFLSLAR